MAYGHFAYEILRVHSPYNNIRTAIVTAAVSIVQTCTGTEITSIPTRPRKDLFPSPFQSRLYDN